MRPKLVVAVATVLVLLASATSAGAVSPAPAYAGDFPDPAVLRAAGSYWAYSTGSAGRNLQVMSSTDLKTWTSPVDPLPVLPSWSRPGLTWAPGVVARAGAGPSMVAAGGLYFLFYGAGAWDTANASIGYARCVSPAGPCANASVSGPWMASHGKAVGPSGPDVFVDAAGTTRLDYHAWTGGVGYQNGGVRSLWVDTLRFAGATPAVS
jgi:beta-xylosidase